MEKKHLSRFGGSLLCLFDFVLVSPVLSLASVLLFDFVLVSPVLFLASVLLFDIVLVSPVLTLASVLLFDFVLVSPVLSLANVLLFPESDLFSLVWFWSVSMPGHFFVSLLQYNNTLLILKLKRKFSCPPLTNNKK